MRIGLDYSAVNSVYLLNNHLNTMMVAPTLHSHPRTLAQLHFTENDMHQPLLINVDTHPAMHACTMTGATVIKPGESDQ